MKVKIIMETDVEMEVEADNPFHAQNIMLGAFYICDENGKVAKFAQCNDIPATFEVRDGRLHLDGATSDFLGYLRNLQENKGER